MPVAWPGGSDLIGYLASAGVIDETPTGGAALIDYDAAMVDALAWFEGKTHFQPFEAASADSTRYFTPDGGPILNLHNASEGDTSGVVSITSVCSGVTSTSAGTALTVNSDYYPHPPNYSAAGRPITRLRMAWRLPPIERSVSITGKFGYCAHGQIPQAAWNGVLAAGALLLDTQLGALSGGGMKRITEGDATYEYADLRTVWDMTATAAVNRYRLQRVG